MMRVSLLCGFLAGMLLASAGKAMDDTAHAGLALVRDGQALATVVIPLVLQTVQVLYNVDMFEELGLSEPTTWDEFLAVGDALEGSGVYALANGALEPWTLETLFGGVGPTFYGGDEYFEAVTGGEADFTDPRFVSAAISER